MEHSILNRERKKLFSKSDATYVQKLRYGYVTVLVASLSFGLILIVTGLLATYSETYLYLLSLYSDALRGFVRACLIFIATIAPMMGCQSVAYTKPWLSICLFFVSLITLGFPLGLVFTAYPPATIMVSVWETMGLTLLFCTVGILTKKDLTSLGNFLSFALVGLIVISFLNRQFFHFSWLALIVSGGSMMLFLGYLIYDSNYAMNCYDEAKKLGGVYFASILLANSLDILLDIIIIFLEILGSDDKDDGGSSFDSFW